MRCHCGVEIPEERVELGLTTCKTHSRAAKPVGFMVYGHKTAPDIVIVNSNNKEQLRQALNADERKR